MGSASFRRALQGLGVFGCVSGGLGQVSDLGVWGVVRMGHRGLDGLHLESCRVWGGWKDVGFYSYWSTAYPEAPE